MNEEEVQHMITVALRPIKEDLSRINTRLHQVENELRNYPGYQLENSVNQVKSDLSKLESDMRYHNH
jgi:archaellum component FlaC